MRKCAQFLIKCNRLNWCQNKSHVDKSLPCNLHPDNYPLDNCPLTTYAQGNWLPDNYHQHNFHKYFLTLSKSYKTVLVNIFSIIIGETSDKNIFTSTCLFSSTCLIHFLKVFHPQLHQEKVLSQIINIFYFFLRGVCVCGGGGGSNCKLRQALLKKTSFQENGRILGISKVVI